MQSALPADIDLLRAVAASEGFRFVERLIDEWNSGANRFSRLGEALFGARSDGVLAAVGGRTREAAIPGALRMRRFYVRPDFRGRGIGRLLVEALLAEPRRHGTTVTVNAGTKDAFAFWEAMGFVPMPRGDYTHHLIPAA